MAEKKDMESSGNVIDPEVNLSASKTVGNRRAREENVEPSGAAKKAKLPDGFLEFLPPEERAARPKEPEAVSRDILDDVPVERACRQFWKAGEYEGTVRQSTSTVGMDHVRVHPKFLHANATSHKWALGAIAELLDNAIDEIPNGATTLNIEVIKNPVDASSPMLLFQDDGGGMTGDRMRKCLSFGYSEKTKDANTVGQYGNGFKTSTMRLGADVIVFSKTAAKDGRPPARSVGLLSWTFLTQTGQQDLMVPMLHFEMDTGVRNVLTGSEEDWNRNQKTITKWSPYRSDEALKKEFKKIKNQGTRIVIYNLWEDDQKRLELDFETDPQDIQLRGSDAVNGEMAENHPSARHFYLYKHSLRVYAAILYLKLPENFKMTLRGEEVVLHNIVAEDLIEKQWMNYKPQIGPDDALSNTNVSVEVTLGFLKDAGSHIDVQGFNVYHRNRLIKPYWRIWHPGSSQGRGVIGVLEANFVQPAHDKQGFERTVYLQRLEARLKQMQKNYWTQNSHKVGYANNFKAKSVRKARRNQKLSEESSDEAEVDMEINVQDDEDDYPLTPPFVTPLRRSRSRRDSEDPITDSSRRAKPVDAEEPRTSSQRRAKAQAKPVEEPRTDSSKKLAVRSKTDEEEPPKRRFKVTPAKRTAPRKASPTPLQAVPSEQSPMEVDEIQSGKQVVLNEGSSPELDLADMENRVRVNELAQANEVLNSRLQKLERTDVTDLSRLELEAANQQLLIDKAHLETALEEERDRRTLLEKEVCRMEDELRALQEGVLKERNSLVNERERERESWQKEKQKLEMYLKMAEDDKKDRDNEEELIRVQLKNALRRQRELDEEKKKLEDEKKKGKF